MIKQNKQ